jgi:acyl-CoA thioester hydrolase
VVIFRLGFRLFPIILRPLIKSVTEICVRYAETDKMSVVYHGNYFSWFEVGRVGLLNEVGIPYREIEKAGYQLPVLEAHAEFASPAEFDDHLTVETTIPEKPMARVRLNYAIHRGTTLIASGYTVHVFINERGAPVRPPKLFRDHINPCF